METFFQHTAVPLTSEQQKIKAVAAEIAANVAAPKAAEVDHNELIDDEALKAYKDSGLMYLAVPREIGGSFCGVLGIVVGFEELGVACGSTSLFVNAANIGFLPLLLAGTEDQQKAAFALMQKGRGIANFSITEPHAGSDVAAINSTAVLRNGEWQINGRKSLVEAAGIADITMFFVKTNPEAGKDGITCFAIPGGTPGNTFLYREETMGMRGIPYGEIELKDVKVPEEALIGEPGSGFQIAMDTIIRSRVGSAGTMMGIARGALEYATRYAREREAFGRPIAKLQGISFMLADMAIELETSRAMVYSAARMIDEGKADQATLRYLAGVAKCHATDACMKITTDAVQVLGGWGYTRRHPVERMMRDAKSMQLGDGSNQIQRVIISHELIKRLGEA